MTNLGLIIALILTAIVGVLIETLLKLILPEKPSGRHVFTIMMTIGIFSFLSVQISNYQEDVESVLSDDLADSGGQSRGAPEVETSPLADSNDNEESNIPTPTVTFTSSPTSTSRATFTPRPTASPLIDVSPRNLMPSDLPIPETLAVEESRTTSNENIAERHDKPTEIYQLLETWERETGYYTFYMTKENCESIADYWDLGVNIVIHSSSEGAKHYWDWITEREKEDENLERQENLEGLGDFAVASWFTGKDNCETPRNWRRVYITFVRYNALGSVYLTVASDSVSEAETHSLPLRISQLIDLKFVANASE